MAVGSAHCSVFSLQRSGDSQTELLFLLDLFLLTAAIQLYTIIKSFYSIKRKSIECWSNLIGMNWLRMLGYTKTFIRQYIKKKKVDEKVSNVTWTWQSLKLWSHENMNKTSSFLPHTVMLEMSPALSRSWILDWKTLQRNNKSDFPQDRDGSGQSGRITLSSARNKNSRSFLQLIQVSTLWCR